VIAPAFSDAILDEVGEQATVAVEARSQFGIVGVEIVDPRPADGVSYSVPAFLLEVRPEVGGRIRTRSRESSPKASSRPRCSRSAVLLVVVIVCAVLGRTVSAVP
jgi:hypothetical protein